MAMVKQLTIVSHRCRWKQSWFCSNSWENTPSNWLLASHPTFGQYSASL
jgi:hypothetical protein